MVLLACSVIVFKLLKPKSYIPFLTPGHVPPQGLAEPLSSKPRSLGVSCGQSDSQTTLIHVYGIGAWKHYEGENNLGWRYWGSP